MLHMSRYICLHNLFNYEQCESMKVNFNSILSAPPSVSDTSWMLKKYQMNKQVNENISHIWLRKPTYLYTKVYLSEISYLSNRGM